MILLDSSENSSKNVDASNTAPTGDSLGGSVSALAFEGYGRRGLEKTPASNTGFPSQSLGESGITVKVDTVTGVCRAVSGLADAHRIVSLAEEVFDDCIGFDADAATTMGRSWDGHSKSSVRGVRFWWAYPKGSKPGELYISVPGAALGNVSHVEAHDFFCLLHFAYGFECSRIDIALDDFTRSTPLDTVAEAARRGDYAYARSHRIYESAKRSDSGLVGKTVYFGSPASDKLVRVYDKTVESGGKIDAIRWELQLRKAKAALVCSAWLEIEPRRIDRAGAEFLASLVTGSVHFCDRTKEEPNLDRLPVLGWWGDFVSRVGGAVKICMPKKVSLFETSLKWLRSQVSPTWAMARRILGDAYQVVHYALLEEGEARFNSRHTAIIARASGEWSDTFATA